MFYFKTYDSSGTNSIIDTVGYHWTIEWTKNLAIEPTRPSFTESELISTKQPGHVACVCDSAQRLKFLVLYWFNIVCKLMNDCVVHWFIHLTAMCIGMSLMVKWMQVVERIILGDERGAVLKCSICLIHSFSFFLHMVKGQRNLSH